MQLELGAGYRPTPDGCWEYQGYLDRDGYGELWVKGVGKRRAHRAFYEAAKGEIPAGLVIHHQCGNRRCVNPDHLEVVSNEENTGPLGKRAQQTHCKNGHELTPDNLVPNRTNRSCLLCHRERSRLSMIKYRDANREQYNAQARARRANRAS